MMQKNKWILALAIFTLLLAVIWYLYINYLQTTFHTLQDKLHQKIDTISTVAVTPEAAYNQDCKYDIDSQTDDFLKGKTKYSDYTWNDAIKEATIKLENDDILIIKRGGCKQFDFYITAIIVSDDFSTNNKNEVYQVAMKWAEEFFENEDYNKFWMALNDNNYELDSYPHEFRLLLKEPTFCHAEIYFHEEVNNKEKIIKIGFTKC
jgi:hypothetical protein